MGLMTKGPVGLLFFLPTLLVYTAVVWGWRVELGVPQLLGLAAMACVLFVGLGTASGAALLAMLAAAASLVALACLRGRGVLLDRRWLAALAVVLVLGLPWPVLLVRGSSFHGVWRIAVMEVWKLRYGSVGVSNLAPWWYYLAIFSGISFPWVLLYPLAFLPGYGAEDAGPEQRMRLFTKCWLLSGLALFTVISSAKEARYLLPLFPALSVLTADVLVRGIRGQLRAGVQRYFRGLTTLTVAGACVAPLAAVPLWFAVGLGFSPWVVAIGLVMGLAGVVGVVLHRVRRSPWSGSAALAILMIAVKMFATFGLAPDRSSRLTARHVCRAVRAAVPAGHRLYLFGTVWRPVMYYLDPEPLRPSGSGGSWFEGGRLRLVCRAQRRAEIESFGRGERPLYVCMDRGVRDGFPVPSQFRLTEVARFESRKAKLALVRLERRREP